jgi:predicted transglutaminase-like cysteine proteinase
MSAVPTPVVLAPSAPSQITVAPAVVQWSPAVDDLRDIAKFTPTVAPEASDRLQAKAALLRALAAKRYDAKTLDPGRWSRGPQSAVTAPFPLPVAPRPEPRAPMTASPAPVPPNLGAPRLDAQVATMDLLTQVNRSLNRRIGRNSDVALYGREDVWTIPTGDRAQGDCEDYVLAKRQALIEAGVSADALSIAVVRTRRGWPEPSRGNTSWTICRPGSCPGPRRPMNGCRARARAPAVLGSRSTRRAPIRVPPRARRSPA